MFLVCQVRGEGNRREVLSVTGVVPEYNWGHPFTLEKGFVKMPADFFNGALMQASILRHPHADPGIAYVPLRS